MLWVLWFSFLLWNIQKMGAYENWDGIKAFNKNLLGRGGGEGRRGKTKWLGNLQKDFELLTFFLTYWFKLILKTQLTSIFYPGGFLTFAICHRELPNWQSITFICVKWHFSGLAFKKPFLKNFKGISESFSKSVHRLLKLQ